MSRRRVGIFGGSFNPVHIGHTIIADYIRQISELDEVWMMLSPANPLKVGDEAPASDSHRMAMLRMAAEGITGITACDFELALPRPSFTYITLRELSRQFADTDFTLIIGSDNWQKFNLWKNSQEILNNYPIIVYPRKGSEPDAATLPENVTVAMCPELEISSTFIRKKIKEGLDVSLFLPAGVYSYIAKNHLYGK